MRQLSTRACARRLVLGAAAASAIALTASSPIGSAVSARHAAGKASASPAAPAGGVAVKADCSMATARRLANQHRLNHFVLPNPIRQLLCGSFTGPGSKAMAITIGAPTCWPVQHWAVFSFTAGAWRLVLEQPAYLIPPLAAVGSDIRETTAVHRPGDSRCNPSGGTRARVWHWNGTRLTAGPWKQVRPATRTRGAGFRSPSGGIECGMGDDGRVGLVECWTFRPPQKATLNPGGRLTICRGSEARCKLANIGEGPTLAYGRQITVGRFRCLSLRSGMRCTVIRSGKGFLINRAGVHRVGS
jgi:hypothetical protein